MKGFIIGLIIVLVLLAGGFWLFGQDDDANNDTPTPTNTTQDTTPDTTTDTSQTDADEPDEATVVTYTDDGFSPATVTIQLGERVTFVNNSSDDFRVASDDHPEHNEYPGFDSQEDLAPGQSYSFSFDNTGTWGYHNHLNESDTGTIVVTP